MRSTGLLTFRRATHVDIESLRALAFAIWREYYPAVISIEQIDYMLARMYDVEVMRGELDRGVAWEVATLVSDPRAGVAEPAGFLSYGPLEGGRIRLHKLYLLPRFHGQGFGRQAIEHVKEEAARAGANTIYLQVNKGNARAIEAYHRAGFRTIDEIVVDIGGGFVMDDFFMEITLSPGSLR